MKSRIRISARGQFVAYGFSALLTVAFAAYGVLAAAAHAVRLIPVTEVGSASSR